jgi:regulatory protein
MKNSMTKPKKVADTGRTPMDAALRYLGARARTAREIERHLDACEYGEVEVYDTVERLKDLGLVNDLAFAQEFVRTRLATKPISRAHLREQLLAHEVEQDAIDQALEQVDDESQQRSAAAVAEKYARQYARLPEKERDEMVLRRLLSRGYSYDDARAAMRALGAETE